MPPGGRPLIVMAMEAEAAPVRSALNLDTPGEKLHPAFSSEIWESSRVCLVLNGKDRRYGVDSIASQPAAIASLRSNVSAQALSFQQAQQVVLSTEAGTSGRYALLTVAISTIDEYNSKRSTHTEMETTQ